MHTCKRRHLYFGIYEVQMAILDLILDVVDVVVYVRTFRQFALVLHIIRQMVHVELQRRQHDNVPHRCCYTVGNT